MNVLNSLKALSAFPIMPEFIEQTCINHGLDAAEEATAEMVASSKYQLAKADIYRWLVLAPTISQGGISFALTEEQRKAYKAAADAIDNAQGRVNTSHVYGYKGTKL